jgi:hypothetical protein
MRKTDIKSLGDIYKRLIVEQDMSKSQPGSDVAYDKLNQNLRENSFTASDSGEPIVVFYTKKPPSDDENDKLHNAAGPAVIFGQGGEGNEFYFIEGQLVEKDSPEYREAAANLRYKSSMQGIDEEPVEDFSAFD